MTLDEMQLWRNSKERRRMVGILYPIGGALGLQVYQIYDMYE